MATKGFWKPNPKQAQFLALPWTIKEGFYGGGAGSGKSDVLLMYGIVHKLHKNPLFKQVFMRRTYPDLKKEIVPRSREMYRPFGATFNQTDMVWTFPREDQYGSGTKNAGASIFLGHCEQEKDVHNYDSMEISLFTPDELTNCTEYIYLYIAFERNRAPKDSGLPSIVRGAGMPGGIGHTFVKKRFVDPDPNGGKIIIGRGGNKRIYIHATLEDNKEHIDPTYAQSLDGRPDAERKAKKFGDWSAYLGQVFDEFRDRKYPDEPSNALHVIAPFEIPDWWPRFVIGDWGYIAMCYIGFFAISPTGRMYLYRERSYLKTKISVWGPEIKHLIDKDKPRSVKFCRSAKQDRGQEHTIQEQIEKEIGRSIELSTNSPGSRLAGKTLIHEFLRWRQKPTIPPEEMPTYSEEYFLWLQRNKTPADCSNYLAIFEPPQEETNIPRLQIMCCEETHGLEHDHIDCCPLMIEAIKACNYDKPQNDKPAEDVAEFAGDDPYDTLRYAVDSADAYFKNSAEEFVRVQRQQQIIEALKNTNDWTAYYRNMRIAESTPQSSTGMQVVRRFHSRRR
jgi:hypothetical protein